MAYYGLAEAFPEFLVHAPRRATSALVAVMESYVTHHYIRRFGEVIEESFTFDDQEARFCPDYSVSWDASGAHGHEYPLKMLNVFEEHLERLAAQEDGTGEARALIEALVQENRLAVFWRRLLFWALGSRIPWAERFCLLPELFWSLRGATRLHWLASSSRQSSQGCSQMSASEFKIHSCPFLMPYPMDRGEGGEHIRNRLLGCLS